MKICASFVLLCMTFASFPFLSQSALGQTKEISFSLQLRNGSIIQLGCVDSEFDWKTVAADGAITQSRFKVSEIESLKFTVSPASDEVARIRALVAQLASDDYRQRHQAERTLLTEGKPFEKVIEQARDHKEPEVRYRVDRILAFLKIMKQDNVTRFSIDFDLLELKDGRKLEGDIGDWALKGIWNETEISLDRTNCKLVQTELPFKVWNENTNTASTKRVTASVVDEMEFYESVTTEDEKTRKELKEGLRNADFETGERGEKMVSDRSFDVGSLFAHRGALMNCETFDGIVIVSGYKFKHSSSKGRSVGNFYVEPTRKKKTNYQGVMRIDFCIPGNGQVPATVDMAGVFAEIVIPQHTIIEAFNAAGHVIGLTWSARDKYSFLGIRSNEPIAYVKVAANTYLDVVKLNRDFAIDDLTYSEPVPAPELNFNDLGDGETGIVIVTNDNQRLLASEVVFSAEKSAVNVKSSIQGDEEFTLPLDNISWITMPQDRDSTTAFWRKSGKPDPEWKYLGWMAPIEYGLFVMLADGSVIHCQSDQNQLGSTTQPELIIDPASVIGVWNSTAVCRYPRPSDFEHGDIVAVQPLNRVAFKSGDFDWDNQQFDYNVINTSFAWTPLEFIEYATVMQQAMQSDGVSYLKRVANKMHLGFSRDEPDPGKIELKNNTNSSIWTQLPPLRAAGTGLLRTNDGQQFVLGGSFGFELLFADGDNVVIKHGETKLTFSLSDIHALNLPQ